MFADAMRKVDPAITLIAAGAMPDVMEGANQAKRINGQYVPSYLSAADWSGDMLACCLNTIDMLSEHYYASGTEHTDLKLEKKVPIGPLSQEEWAREAATQVRAKYEHYQEYLKLIPALRAKPVPIAIDEWAYTGAPRDGFKVTLAYAWAFHEMFRHSDLFQLGAFTFATAMMSENRTDAVLNPTGMLFRMYRDHFGTIPVEVGGDSPQPKPAFPAGGDQPAVNPGSPTYPLDVSAAFTADRRTFTMAVLNPSDHPETMRIALAGVRLADAGKLWRLAPDRVDATVTVGKPPEVVEQQQTLGALPETMVIPAGSVSIVSYAVR
jgi:alpha-N-arabinofuranosidase